VTLLGIILDFIFDFFVGRHAGITSGAFGIVGSVALAIPPIESLKLRTVLLQLFSISDEVPKEAVKEAKNPLLMEAQDLLARERRFNIAGAGLLVAAFVILFINSIYCSICRLECVPDKSATRAMVGGVGDRTYDLLTCEQSGHCSDCCHQSRFYEYTSQRVAH
jgi:hypothetical protein